MTRMTRIQYHPKNEKNAEDAEQRGERWPSRQVAELSAIELDHESPSAAFGRNQKEDDEKRETHEKRPTTRHKQSCTECGRNADDERVFTGANGENRGELWLSVSSVVSCKNTDEASDVDGVCGRTPDKSSRAAQIWNVSITNGRFLDSWPFVGFVVVLE